MIALVVSALIAAYLLIPNAWFRFVLSLFVPLRVFQENKTEDLIRAVVTLSAVFAISLAAIWYCPFVKNHPLAFADTQQLRASDYQLVIGGLYSEASFEKSGTKFWDALARTIDRQLRFLAWYYALVTLWAALSGFLSKNYYRLRRNSWYSHFADLYLLPHISQWYVLLSSFIFGPGAIVKADVLMTDDTLYQGEVAQHFLDKDGNLLGLFLTNPTRFDRRTYLKDKDAWGTTRPKDFYWHKIPSAKLYLVGDKIINLNLNYSSPTAIEEEIQKLFNQLKVGVSVRLRSSGTDSRSSGDQMHRAGRPQ